MIHSNREMKALHSHFFYNVPLFILLSLTSLLLFCLAVAYSLEADADLRKINLSPRATFTAPSSEKSPTSKGTITINTKGSKKCVVHQLVMQVLTLSGKFVPSLVFKVHCGRGV